MLHIPIEKMTINDINKELHSGKFISATKKKIFQDRLEYLKTTNKFVIKDPKPKKKSISNQLFPTLGDNCIPIKKNVIDYSMIGKIPDESLNLNNTIVIQYDDIINVYDYFAIYRIKLHLVSLRNKIHILNEIRKVRNIRSSLFDEHFKYPKLLQDESLFRECIHKCFGLEHIITFMEYLSNLSNIINETYITKQFNIIYDILDTCKIWKHFSQKMCAIHLAIVDLEYSKYENHVLKKIIDDTRKLQNEIIDEFDPVMKCNYFVNIKNDGTIIPYGISSDYYVDCDDEITSYPPCCNIPKSYLVHLTLDDLTSYFNEKYHMDEFKNFIMLTVAYKELYIRYELIDPINFTKGELKIEGEPNNSYFTSMIINNKIVDDEDKEKVIQKSSNCNMHLWLRDNVDPIHYLDEMEYDNLDDDLQNAYSLMETNQNIFYVDYLFNELHQKYPLVVKPSMVMPFRKLAYTTSRFKN